MFLSRLRNAFFLIFSFTLFLPLYLDASSPHLGLIFTRESDSALPIPVSAIFLSLYLILVITKKSALKLSLKFYFTDLLLFIFLIFVCVVNTLVYGTSIIQHIQYLLPLILPILFSLPRRDLLLKSVGIALASLYAFLLLSLSSSIALSTIGLNSPFATIFGLPIYSAFVSYPALLILALALQLLILSTPSIIASPLLLRPTLPFYAQLFGCVLLITSILSLARKTSLLELSIPIIIFFSVSLYRCVVSMKLKISSIIVLLTIIILFFYTALGSNPIKDRVIEFFDDPSSSGRGQKYSLLDQKFTDNNNFLLSYTIGLPSSNRIGSRGNHNLILDVIESYGVIYTFVYFYLFASYLIKPLLCSISKVNLSAIYPLSLAVSSLIFGATLNVHPIQIIYIIPISLIVKALPLLIF